MATGAAWAIGDAFLQLGGQRAGLRYGCSEAPQYSSGETSSCRYQHSNQLWTRTVSFWLVGKPDPMGFLKIGSNSSPSLNYGTDRDGEEGRDLQKALSWSLEPLCSSPKALSYFPRGCDAPFAEPQLFNMSGLVGDWPSSDTPLGQAEESLGSRLSSVPGDTHQGQGPPRPLRARRHSKASG